MLDNAFLQVTNISAAYDNKSTVVNDVSFDLHEGELACLLGPSGCGKTTILRAIGGFQDLRSGKITLDENIISLPEKLVSPEKRGVGMVFQDHALFPHLTISQNVGFGLQQLTKQERTRKIAQLLELVDMSGYQQQYPHELSGGQSQRVALARAIAPEPKLLLMDEPFSNLDTELRESLGYEIRELLKELSITAIMVTHDQHDAFALGDKIGVISQGRLAQWDTSFNLYHAPINRFVANFIGEGVFVKGSVTSDNTVTTTLGVFSGEMVNSYKRGQDIEILIRPDDVKYDPSSKIQGQVTRKAFKGAQTLYTISTPNRDELMSLLPSHENHEVGDIIGVSIHTDHLVCFK